MAQYSILSIHLGEKGEKETFELEFFENQFHVIRYGCRGDLDYVAELIERHINAGDIDCVSLEEFTDKVDYWGTYNQHKDLTEKVLSLATGDVPIVTGSDISGAMERWALNDLDSRQPNLLAKKKILLAPRFGHRGYKQCARRFTNKVDFADSLFYFNESAPAKKHIPELTNAPMRRLKPVPGTPKVPRSPKVFNWAQIICGDIGSILRYSPEELLGKTVIVPHATPENVLTLQDKGVSALVITTPAFKGYPVGDSSNNLGMPYSLIQAVIMCHSNVKTTLTEDKFMNVMAEYEWDIGFHRLEENVKPTRFAFAIHPLSTKMIYIGYPYLKIFPDMVVESAMQYLPPGNYGKIANIKSKFNGHEVEGIFKILYSTPKMMMGTNPRITYDKLVAAAKSAQRQGANLMGLGAFTSVVGDAGITVDRESDIAITSGNSLTVCTTLEAAKQAVMKMGYTDLTKGKVMVIGATGSIGAVCSRLIAQATKDLVLVSTDPVKLAALKKKIQNETPGSRVIISTCASDNVAECDLIITATSAFGKRIIDITKCKPGATICDVARPLDISADEAALRPDICVIESGEVKLPCVEGKELRIPKIGLPKGTVYACLAETALLALDNRFESYTLGRQLDMKKVKLIYKLYHKHGLELAGLRSFGGYLTDEDFAEKSRLAKELLNDPEKLARVKYEAGEKLKLIPVSSKGLTVRAWYHPEVICKPFCDFFFSNLFGIIFCDKKKLLNHVFIHLLILVVLFALIFFGMLPNPCNFL